MAPTESAAGFRALAGTYNFDNSSISFCELPVLGWQGDDAIVEDENELVTSSWLDCPGSDCVLELLAPGELVTDEMKEDIEYRLRMRLAHLDICHPNIPLKELPLKQI